jgi:SPP1 family predicted phage head-tail adaptor
MSIRAGELREQIVIEQAAKAQDTAGQEIRTWSTLATVWAAFEPERGREYTTSRTQVDEQPVLFRIRHRSDVDAGCRVSFGGKVYDILSAMQADGQRAEMHLFCSAGVRPEGD